MAAARERLVVSSEKLRFAFSSFRAINEEVVARTTGVDALPLSQATARRVSEAANMAKTVALSVLKAAEAAEAAAATAEEVVSAVQEAKSAAAAKLSAAKEAVEAAQAAKAAAEAATAAATAMESEFNPPVVRDRRKQSRDDNSGTGSGHADSMASAGLEAEIGDIMVEVKTGKSDMSDEAEEAGHCTPQATEDQGEANESSHDGNAVSAFGSTDQETQEEAETTPGNNGGEQKEQEEGHGEEEEQEVQQQQEKQDQKEGHAQKASRGKRKLGGAAKPLRRYSVRGSGSRRPEYADSPTREPSKRQRKASEPGTGKQCGGGGAATVPKTSTPMIARRHAHKKRRSCQEHGCTTQPSFGNIGSKKAEYCKRHAKKGMVNVVNMRCSHPGCTTQPSFGNIGSKKEFCCQHAKKDMVNVCSKRCGHPGCMKGPSFGETGSKMAEFCKRHAKQGMVDVVHKKCGHPGCMKRPPFGETGSKKAEFCKRHAKRGMVSVRYK